MLFQDDMHYLAGRPDAGNIPEQRFDTEE